MACSLFSVTIEVEEVICDTYQDKKDKETIHLFHSRTGGIFSNSHCVLSSGYQIFTFMMQVLKEDGTPGIISKTSKGQRITQQDYSVKRMGPKYHRRSCGLFIVLTDWNA
ncbi:hypothetical protein AAG906_012159 [Vitis piasezkii]